MLPVSAGLHAGSARMLVVISHTISQFLTYHYMAKTIAKVLQQVAKYIIKFTAKSTTVKTGCVERIESGPILTAYSF